MSPVTDSLRTPFAMVPCWVIERVTEATALRVYNHLACRYANAKRHAFPEQAVLAADLNLAERTVKRALQTLREADAIVVTRARRSDGYYGRNLYFLPLDDPRGDHQGTQMSRPADQGKQGVSAGHVQGTQMSHPPGDTDVPSEVQLDPEVQLDTSTPSADADAPPSATQPPLINPPVTSKAGVEPKDSHDEKGPTAREVVAAWVDGCRENQVEPSKSQVGQVAKLAKELLGGNDPQRVLDAAGSAGRKGFPSIDRELTAQAAKRNSRPGGRSPGPFSGTAAPPGAPRDPKSGRLVESWS